MCKEKRELNQRVSQKKTSEIRENFSTKTKKQGPLKALNFLNFLAIVVVMNLSPNTPIYRRGLGFKDKT